MEKFTFFYGGPFSQWYMTDFVVGALTYNCAEQYMMAEKARLFGDGVTLLKIMTSKSPKEQKALGRRVENFDADVWNEVAKDIVYKGNYSKFQDPGLKEILLWTRGTTLVEASPYDTIWGIGLDAMDQRAQNRDTWKGTNWLGEVLTKLREDLISEIDFVK